METPKVTLIRKGGILVAHVPKVRKVSVQEVTEWIRKARDRKI